MKGDNPIGKILWVVVFGVSMAFVEAAVVVYLRAIYYPEGFSFPLKLTTDYKILVEVLREIATIFMLLSVAVISGKRFYERFAYFLIAFGTWDIFYYIWLKLTLGWPSTIFDWDILFLTPLPWIGPVIAPVSIAILLVIFGILIVYSSWKGYEFKPPLFSYVLALIGAGSILYSFMRDTDASLRQQLPQPYQYHLLFVGGFLLIMAFLISYLKRIKK